MDNPFSEIFDRFDLKGVHIVRSGATFDDDMTWETAEAFGTLLAGAYDWMQNDMKLVYGDFLNHCEWRWGETYAQLVYITGMAVEQLRDYKWVAGQVPLSLRNDNLRYSHYRVVAKGSLSFEQKREWLNMALESGWGARELREAVAEWESEVEDERDSEAERILVEANLIDATANSRARAERFVWQEGDIQIVHDDNADDEPENGVFAAPEAADLSTTASSPDNGSFLIISESKQREIIGVLLDAEKALISFDFEKVRGLLRSVKRLLWPDEVV